ncbi:TPA: aminotransferase class V-fold PLP-dependent enzyme [Clostridium botulinum]|uniref:aminotransferase class V-fold PLP-dependent enzyme n=1 Tax=Clostridium botulinum TaxID=1491 RepID=UPI0008FC870C|nr:aminotransferase class V-fold PLP-dependent enzyme [Clostridium botulinum]APC79762.1 aminotransferase class-V family protein [Clostridium botulinum]MCS4448939.1 aminotransferase class V-fold PLP-dependent enzyme [Clostridium botulinum]MCS4456307.1 aminotransferase class V-fold PLP-dependent enzyme [Clostridium botulinum]MCS4461582.1 aminotransferase class V-fold PLP-dependent enzyme [Clostridium botulinum]MCS4513418.1 aminotransferase class V-fold PLP-dependent enzyme [Clostridium botulinum
MKVYLDNAATTYPKPEKVYSSILNYMKNVGASPGRGGYENALTGDRIVYKCRQSLINLFNFNKIENVVFTSNITASLNILIKSIVKDGWHVITSSMDHNSVIRPLVSLEKSNKIELDILNCSEEGLINIEDFKNAIKDSTKLVVLSHASNIVGTIQPLEAIGKICKEKGIYFIIDSAQTAGVLPLNFQNLNCNALAFTGHKSLLGPQGIGGFIIDDELNNIATNFIEGGTGSLSESTLQPDFLPDKFESGTMNTPGIAGLLAGIEYINEEGLNAIKEREEYLSREFINGLLNIDSVKVYGPLDASLRTATISINSSKIDNSELGFLLDSEFGIMVRTGLHCAPLAHKTIGSFPQGTLRFSFGAFNDIKDINYALYALNSILNRM